MQILLFHTDRSSRIHNKKTSKKIKETKAFEEISAHSDVVSAISGILFGCQPDAQAKDKTGNCFQTDFNSSFLHSEQAWIYFLNRAAAGDIQEMCKNFYSTYEPWSTAIDRGKIKDVKHVRVHLISSKDICPFCRGSLSFLLSQNSERNSSGPPQNTGHSWMSRHLEDFLTTLLAPKCSAEESEALLSAAASGESSREREGDAVSLTHVEL